MRALLLCVGRLKEAYLQDACGEYLKRLGRYANLELVELKDEPEPAAPSPALQRRVLEAEGARILQRIRPEDYVVALAIQGQSYFQVEPLEFVLVRQENMYEPENQKLLFPVAS